MKGLFLFSIFVVTYASLFPFEFQYVSLESDRINDLLSTSLTGGVIGDVLGNIILFIPFGFAGAELISRNNPDKKYYIYLILSGFALALALQVIQIYLPSRVPALYDAVWNLAGITIGVVIAQFMDLHFPNVLKSDDRLALLSLLLSWIMFLLVPFIFTFNMELLNENIETHLDPSEYRLINIIFFTGLWISFEKLLDEIKPGRKSIFLTLEFALIFTMIAKMFVYRNIIEPEMLLGGIIAVLMIRSRMFNKINPYKVAALLLIPTMFYNSLYPFEFYENPFKEFAWIPFEELFSDDMLPKIQTVFFKTFSYGCILWTLYKSFPNSNWVNYFCIIYAGIIEYIQHQTLDRVGGLTEPLLVIFLCTFIHQNREVFNLYENEDLETS
ncbi:MAG: VanZ family protein [Kordiimonadaceae bacterium]|nr:VanZ family protein [Kordiimonadaceae bacterium]MBT6035748.1 VanZ family protein [Kordiimonadaceae bacterium]